MENIDNPRLPGLHYEVDGAGRPVLFVHGFGANLYTWKHLIAPLSPGFRLIRVDLKGHGLSPKPADKNYSVYDQAALVYQLILKLDLKDLTLVGHSFGGAVSLVTALQLIEREPNRLAKLILIGSAAYRQSFPLFIKTLRTPIIGPLAIWLLPNRFQVRSILRSAYYDDAKITSDFVREYAKPLDLPGAKNALIETARQIVPSDIEQLVSKYPKIKAPTLILWGREDEVVPRQVGERLRQAIPNSELVILDRCGHVPQEEEPEKALAIISRFLSGGLSAVRGWSG